MRISLGLSFLQIGTVLSAGLAATMVLQLLVGSLSDIGHANLLLFAGFGGIVLVDFLFPASSTFLLVLTSYVLLRSAAAVYHPVSFSAIGRTHLENKTAAFGYQGAVGDFGLALATFSTGILSQAWGWEAPFWVWGAIGMGLFAYFAATVIRYKMVFYPRLVSHAGRSTNALKSKSLKSTFAPIAIASSLTTITFILFTGYMPLYFNVVHALTPAESTAIVAAWIAIGVVAGLATGRVSNRLGGEVRTLRLMFTAEAVLLALAACVFSAGFDVPFARLVGYLAIILTGIPVFITFPAVNGLLGLRMPHRRLGLTYGMTLSLGLLAASGTTYMTGYLASTMSISVALPVLLVVAVVAVVTSLIL
jgi:MFS family permease